MAVIIRAPHDQGEGPVGSSAPPVCLVGTPFISGNFKVHMPAMVETNPRRQRGSARFTADWMGQVKLISANNRH